MFCSFLFRKGLIQTFSGARREHAQHLLPFNLIPERTRTLLSVLSSRLFASEPLGGAMSNSWVVELEG